jgi:hypothetical protein
MKRPSAIGEEEEEGEKEEKLLGQVLIRMLPYPLSAPSHKYFVLIFTCILLLPERKTGKALLFRGSGRTRWKNTRSFRRVKRGR